MTASEFVDRTAADDATRISTSCAKWITVERGEHGTRIVIDEPERGLGSAARSLWANLSPRAVRELIDALDAACPRAAALKPAPGVETPDQAVQRVLALAANWYRDADGHDRTSRGWAADDGEFRAYLRGRAEASRGNAAHLIRAVAGPQHDGQEGQ